MLFEYVAGETLNISDKTVLCAVEGYHDAHHGTDEVRAALTAHPEAAPLLRDMGNLILRANGEEPVSTETSPLALWELATLGFEPNPGEPEIIPTPEQVAIRETSPPAYVLLWDMNKWLLLEEPESHHHANMEPVHESMGSILKKDQIGEKLMRTYSKRAMEYRETEKRNMENLERYIESLEM